MRTTTDSAGKEELVFRVTVKTPAGTPKHYVAQYIRDAIQGWNGGLDPTDYLFGAFSEPRDIIVRPEKIS